MQSEFLIGVDGGGTHCRTRLTTPDGVVLAECKGGSANVYSDFPGALQTVHDLIDQTFWTANLPLAARQQTRAVWGLAGANVPSVARRLQQLPSLFASLSLLSDVDIACAGAHHGQPGAVLIIGTGSQGPPGTANASIAWVAGDFRSPIRVPERSLVSARCVRRYRRRRGLLPPRR